MPTINSIAGDKLTAFAPGTTGIQYNKNKEMEIIKQLFDIGYLFDQVDDVGTVFRSFETIAQQEIEYRKLDIQIDDVLDNVISTALLIPTRGAGLTVSDLSRYRELEKGIYAIRNHLISRKFLLDDAIAAAGKSALLAARLKSRDFSPLELFKNSDVSGLEITHPDFGYLNRLRKLPDKSAFFYWYQTFMAIRPKVVQ